MAPDRKLNDERYGSTRPHRSILGRTRRGGTGRAVPADACRRTGAASFGAGGDSGEVGACDVAPAVDCGRPGDGGDDFRMVVLFTLRRHWATLTPIGLGHSLGHGRLRRDVLPLPVRPRWHGSGRLRRVRLQCGRPRRSGRRKHLPTSLQRDHAVSTQRALPGKPPVAPALPRFNESSPLVISCRGSHKMLTATRINDQ
jgi:hypothetical protein